MSIGGHETRLLCRHLLAQGLAAVAERLGDVQAGDLVGSIEVGQRARNAQRAVEAAGGELQLLRGLAQQLDARLVRHGDLLEQSSRALGVGTNALGAEGRKP